MTHWGWYWKVKKQHKPKALCSWFMEIDSFNMFKNKELVDFVKESKDRIVLEIPEYNLKARLLDDNSLKVQSDKYSYTILVDKMPCNYGGFYCFFHCPLCKSRMRKLYCIQGAFVCRKCVHLGYYSQRLRPSERYKRKCYRIKDSIEKRGGSLNQKPPWMKKSTFQKLRIKYVKYDEKSFSENNKEYRAWFGSRVERFITMTRKPHAF